MQDITYKHRLFLFYPLIALLLILTLNLIIFNKYFPLSEGWWEAYAYVNQSGMNLYKDVDIAFSPMFVYVTEFIIDYFGMDFYNLRLFGVAVFLLLSITLYLYISQFTNRVIAAIAVLSSSSLLMTTAPFIAKDYHTYQHLIVVLSLVTFSLSFTSKNFFLIIVFSLFTAVLAFLITMIKQNVGALLLIAYFIGILFSSIDINENRCRWARPLSYLVGIFFAILLFYKLGVLQELMWSMEGNDAKGSIVWVLTKAFTGENFYTLLASTLLSVVVILVFEIEGFSELNFANKNYKEYILRNRKSVLLIIAFLIIYILTVSNSISLGRILFFSGIFTVLLTYFYFSFVKGFSGIFCKYLFFPIAALVYANTTTSMFDYNGLYEVQAISISILMYYAMKNSKLQTGLVLGAFTLVALFFALNAYYTKLLQPYSWFIGSSKSVMSAKYSLPYDELNGIYVDRDNHRVYSTVHQYVEKYSSSNNDVYFYNLPIFLTLEHKLPPFRLVTQWLDVTKTESIDNELSALKNKTPNLIVAHVPNQVIYDGHAELTNRSEPFVQERIINYLFSSAVYSRIKLEECISYELSVQKYGKRTLKISIINPEANISHQIKSFNKENDSDLVIVTKPLIVSLDYDLPKGNVIMANDIIIYGHTKDIIDFSSKIGYINEPAFQSVCIFSKNKKILK